MADADGKIVVIRKKDRIDYILSGICDYYNITKEELCHYARSPQKVLRKQIAMKILHEIADCSFKETMYAMNYKEGNEGAIFQHLSKFNDALDSMTTGSKLIKSEYKNVLNHLKL
jgi:hypothetical protein